MDSNESLCNGLSTASGIACGILKSSLNIPYTFA
jgi:hypothetical protein